jgi:hypothetical protein
MNVKNFFEADSFYLNEGISLLKNSKRLAKLANKLENKLSLVPEDQKEQAEQFIDNIKEVAQEYVEVENAYASKDKEEAKAAYNKLNIKYYNLIKLINKETIKKFIIGAGAFFVLSVLLSIFKNPITGGTESTGAIPESLRTLANSSFVGYSPDKKMKAVTKVIESFPKKT